MRKLQTTLTQIFIVLESESHGLSDFGQFILEIETDFSAKFGNSNAFSAQKQVISKKKKVFTKIETDFSARIGISYAFSGRITTSAASQFRRPISFGRSCFHFFTKNRPQKHQIRAILHTLQVNGREGSSPPRPPGYATGSLHQ